jgi:hypothetical protein
MTRSEFEAMTKDELVAYADDRDIEVHHHWTKDEIITEIMKAEKKIAKQEAKQDTTEQAPPEPAVASADQPVDKSVAVDPDVAAAQELANKPQDQSTLFAAKDPPVVRKDG